jgi:FixJ family two-component response regulator
MTGERDAVIHVVDDDESTRVSLTRLLEGAGYAVKTYASAGDFLVAEPDIRPGCMLLDLQMPGPNGLALQDALHRRGDAMPTVFISAHQDIPHTVIAIKGGASDFLLKPLNANSLMAAIESALAVVAARAGRERDADHQAAKLNERELVVLRGIAAGRLNKQLASDLDLSERTIKSCRADLMRKVGARSLADLMRLAAPLLRD